MGYASAVPKGVVTELVGATAHLLAVVPAEARAVGSGVVLGPRGQESCHRNYFGTRYCSQIRSKRRSQRRQSEE